MILIQAVNHKTFQTTAIYNFMVRNVIILHTDYKKLAMHLSKAILLTNEFLLEFYKLLNFG